MYNILYKNKIIKSYRTKYEAQEELDNRQQLCYVLKLKDHETYSIAKGYPNATRRTRKKRAMP